MKIFFAFFSAMMKRQIEYRGAMVVYFFSTLFHIGTALLVWLSAENQVFPGFTKAELVGYYIVMIFLNWVIDWSMFYTITQEIKNGDIQKDLIKPYSYYSLNLSKSAAFHLSAAILFFAGAAIIYVLFNAAHAQVTIPTIPLVRLPLFLLAIGVGIMINFTFRFVLGLLAFWITEVAFIDYVYFTIFPFLAGDVIPLSFLPRNIQNVNRFLPFRYQLSFPLEIMFGKVDTQQIFFGLGVALAWFCILFTCYKIIWRKGSRSYMAFGH